MQLTWLRTVHSGDWCLRSALRTLSGACQKWWWWWYKGLLFHTMLRVKETFSRFPSPMFGTLTSTTAALSGGAVCDTEVVTCFSFTILVDTKHTNSRCQHITHIVFASHSKQGDFAIRILDGVLDKAVLEPSCREKNQHHHHNRENCSTSSQNWSDNLYIYITNI